MLNAPTKKTALAPSGSVVATPGPLPGTEPGAGSFRVKLNPRVFSRVVKLFAGLMIATGAVLAAFSFVFAEPTVSVGGSTFTVRVADEYHEQVTGLSTTQYLEPNEGMLFVYNQEEFYSFWMKDMTLAIDIVWLDANKQVINVHHNVTPDTYPKAFMPNRPAMYVLELAAGAANSAGIQEGQTATFRLGL